MLELLTDVDRLVLPAIPGYEVLQTVGRGRMGVFLTFRAMSRKYSGRVRLHRR